MLLSCFDNTLRLFDKGSGELLNEYFGHKSELYKVKEPMTCSSLILAKFQIESCLTNTDAHVISGSEDNNIYIWSLVDVRIAHLPLNYSQHWSIQAALVQTLKSHTKMVNSLDYHPKE